jgi:peptidase A4-like protein
MAIGSVGGVGGAAGAGVAGAAAPHVALPAVSKLFNVPPLFGKHILAIGLGRHKNMTQVGSTNWAGYANINDTYQSVSGSWVQPSVTCAAASSGGGGLLGGLLGGSSSASGTAAYSSFWVGLDGESSSSVEQAGTSSDCLNSGQASYYAWYEMFPAGEKQITTSTEYKVNPGDTLTGTISSTSGSSFTLSLADATEGWTFSIPLSGNNLARSSAEWIAEAPSSCNALFCSGLPLADFNSVNFFNAVAENTAGVTGPIPRFTDAQITMQSNGTVKAAATPFTNSVGNQFTVRWQHS